MSVRLRRRERAVRVPVGAVPRFAGLAVLAVVAVLVWLAIPAIALAASPQPEGSNLPDGRVYEQVTPAEKGGASASGRLGVVQSSIEGNGLVFFSEPTLPGSEGASGFGTYLASRGADNWATQGLLPPASLGREGFTAGWSEDLRFSYLLVKVPGDGSNFFRRENSTRALTLIAHFPSEFGLSSVIPVATSSNDSTLLFEARKQLAPGASEETNLYLWDSLTDTIYLASALNGGEAPAEGVFAGPYKWQQGETASGGPASELYTPGALTEDGTGAYFTTAGPGKIYLRRHIAAAQSQLSPGGDCEEPAKGCSVEVSASQAMLTDPNGEKPAAFLAATTRGPSVVFFASSGKLTDDANTGATDEGFDIYRYEAGSGQLADVTADTVDPNGAEFRGLLGINEDGTRAYFVANGVLGNGSSLGATRGDCTLPPTTTQEVSGACNLYLWEKGAGVRYIAQLNASGRVAYEGGKPGVSDAANWIPGPIETFQPTARVSDDGQTLVFRSQQALTNYQNEGVPQFYRYQIDGGTGRLSCLTCNPSGIAPSEAPTVFSIESFASIGPVPMRTRNLSEDGNRFIFESGEALVPEDTNGDNGCPIVKQPFSGVPRCQDVYEWEAEGSGSCVVGSANGGCTYLLSTGKSSDPSFFADADGAANNAFFYTSQRLVAQDRDQLIDIYDARVGGGLPSQMETPPERCSAGVACRGPLSIGSSSDPVAGSAVAPPVSARKRVRCGKGLRRTRRKGHLVCVSVARRPRHKGRSAHPGKSMNKPSGSQKGENK